MTNIIVRVVLIDIRSCSDKKVDVNSFANVILPTLADWSSRKGQTLPESS